MAHSKDTTYSETKSESGSLDRTEILVPIGDDVYQVLMEHQSLLSDVIEKKFGCVSYLTGSASLTTQTSSVCPTIVYWKPLKKVQLSVWKDDLTRHTADAVVNAANNRLDHVGGLALALVTAGGKKIEKESKMWVEQHGEVPTGKIAVTTGGELQCKSIIHAVGPIWSSYMESICKHELHSAITEVLMFVNKTPDIRSVAIPALSSGLFGFPLELCATIIVRTIKDFCEQTPISPHVKEIRLVNHDDRTVMAMKEACEKILGSTGDSLSNQSPALPSNQASDSISVNGLDLHLIRGRIEDQKTTVIVNSASRTLDLSEGQISAAILKKGGSSLQQELHRKSKKSSSQFKLVMCTKGYNLGCDYVYHILWARERITVQTFQGIISECLKLAQAHQTSSVSFPALGTGVLSLPKNYVADIMTAEVLKFADLHPGKKPDIYFVIYPSDSETFKAFQHALNVARTQHGKASLSHFSADEKRDNESDKPTIRLCGNDHTNVSVAETWIRNTLLSNRERLFIEDQHIFYCGKREHEALSSACVGVSISINLCNSSAKVEIEGPPHNAIKAVLQTEKILCDVQDEYAKQEEENLLHSVVQWSYTCGTHRTNYGAAANGTLEKAFITKKDVEVCVNSSFHTTRFSNDTVMDSKGHLFQLDRKCLTEYDHLPKIQRHQMGSVFYAKFPVESNVQEFQDREKEFDKADLQIIKMERVQNAILMALYQSRKDAVQRKLGRKSVSQNLYQEVPVQFCDFVCRVGFQRVYTQPQEQSYGAGLYFHSNLKQIIGARKKPLQAHDTICILQAEVVTGHYTSGKQSYGVPPFIGSDCTDLYDSIVDSTSPQTFVIFRSSQANPQCLFTCKRKWRSSL